MKNEIYTVGPVCVTCGGTGRVIVVVVDQVSVGQTVESYTACPECGGSARTEDHVLTLGALAPV